VRTASVCVSAPPLSGRYWRIRYESSIVDGGDYRTVVVYKDSQEMIKLDPVPNEWTVLHTAKKTPNFLALHVELYRSIELSRSDVLFSPGCELLLLIGRLTWVAASSFIGHAGDFSRCSGNQPARCLPRE
jgi:hypothetical protein